MIIRYEQIQNARRLHAAGLLGDSCPGATGFQTDRQALARAGREGEMNMEDAKMTPLDPAKAGKIEVAGPTQIVTDFDADIETAYKKMQAAARARGFEASCTFRRGQVSIEAVVKKVPAKQIA